MLVMGLVCVCGMASRSSVNTRVECKCKVGLAPLAGCLIQPWSCIGLQGVGRGGGGGVDMQVTGLVCCVVSLTSNTIEFDS
jgi:hypothetical protein